VTTGWAGDAGATTKCEGRTLIQTQAIVHHSYDDVISTPASASMLLPRPAVVPTRSPAAAAAASHRQSLTTCTRSVLLTSSCSSLHGLWNINISTSSESYRFLF